MGRRRAALSPEAKELKNRIERWRRTRHKRSPMPARLWDEAVSLAKVHGIYRIASELRVSYESLRKRVEGAPRGRRDGSTGFVEVEGAQLVGAFESARAVVEFTDADGAKLVVRLSGGENLDVVALAEAFWNHGE